MHRIRLIPLLTILWAGNAIACPPGTVPQQGIGWQGCAPVPGTGASTPSRSASQGVDAWEDRWGAIAVDETQNGIGIGSASGMKHKWQAEKAALKKCRNKGGSRCSVKFSYYSQCTAVVWGSNGFTINGAATKDQAAEIGIGKCKQANDTNCDVYFSDCSYPMRIR